MTATSVGAVKRGASLTAVTVTFTVDVLEAIPSDTVYVMVAGPLKLDAGVKSSLSSTIATTTCSASTSADSIVSVELLSTSVSFASTSITTAVSSFVSATSDVATGKSFTFSILIVKDLLTVDKSSTAVMRMLCIPTSSFVGVALNIPV